MKEKIRQWVEKQIKRKKVTLTDDLDLYENNVLDSFGIIALISFLIEDMGINISVDEMDPENFKSVNAICDFIEKES